MRHACISNDSLSLHGVKGRGCSAVVVFMGVCSTVGVPVMFLGGEYTGMLFLCSLGVLVVVVGFVSGLCATVLCFSALVSVVLLVVFPLGVFTFLFGGVWKMSLNF